MLTIGCHLSSSKGYLAMAKEAVSINANTFQFFTRNPRGGNAKPLDTSDIAAYNDFAAVNGIGVILAHAPYTLNACAAKEDLRDFAYRVMTEDISRLELIPGTMYNFHPGSHVKQGTEKGIELISGMLNRVLFDGMQTTVLLETMAGKGSEVGGRFEELRAIIDRVELRQHMGVCLDTCHVYDGEYDIVNDLDGVLDEFDRVVGLERLKAIHINDSKNPFGSHKDRHEKIGEGSIGIDAFERIINHPALRDLPFYLETPNELDGYAREIALLRLLYK
ncbi:MAG: deoxyribonuclease IV [Ruminococcaceae bacterium]|nr:deoxyribonuclease IV [Oscillospiraceae bacterium]